jgi:hypothetical protein
MLTGFGYIQQLQFISPQSKSQNRQHGRMRSNLTILPNSPSPTSEICKQQHYDKYFHNK